MFGDLVVSGSDDGNWFAYDRQSGEIRGIFKGDSSVRLPRADHYLSGWLTGSCPRPQVVNVLNPHPKLPIVAISGIDEVVKLFGPTSDPEVAAESNMADQFETIKARNARGEGRARFGSSINAVRSLETSALAAAHCELITFLLRRSVSCKCCLRGPARQAWPRTTTKSLREKREKVARANLGAGSASFGPAKLEGRSRKTAWSCELACPVPCSISPMFLVLLCRLTRTVKWTFDAGSR